MTRREYAWPEIWIAELLVLGLASVTLGGISALWTASALTSTIVAASLARIDPRGGWRLALAYLALGCGLGAALYAPSALSVVSAAILLGLGALGIAIMSLGDRAHYFRLGVAGTLSPTLAALLASWQLGASCALIFLIALAALVQLTKNERTLTIERSAEPERADHERAGHERTGHERADRSDRAELPRVRDGAADAAQSARMGPAAESQSPKALRNSGGQDAQTFAHTLFTGMPNPIAVVDHAGRFAAVNPAFVSLFGYTEPEARGGKVADLIVPGHLREAATRMHDRVKAGETVTTETERRRKDGALVNVRVSLMPTQVDGHPAALVLYTDITALRAAQARFEQVVASSTAVIYATRIDGDTFTPTYVSENLTRLTGHNPDDALDPSWWYDHVHADDRDRVLGELPSLLTSGELVTEYRFRPAKGPYRWIHDEARLVRDAAGLPQEIVGAWLDITDRRQSEQAMAEAKDVAERLARTRAAFLANMSHEIRTPLNAVLGLTELVLDTDLSTYQRRSLDMVRSAGETLLSLLNDVLDYSKIEAEQVTLESIPFDLRYLVESTAGLLAVRIVDRPVELLSEISPDMPHMLQGDPTRLRQVLTNLVGNAIKFTTQGEVVLAALMERTTEGQCRVKFVVRDTGIGIKPEQLTSIFEEFTQADASMTRKYGGTGLGLAISKRIVGLMGSELAVKSEFGVGSEFSFTLTMPVEESQPATVSIGHAQLAGRRMLIVDDNSTNRRIVRDMLTAAGVTVEEAAGAETGIAELRQARAEGQPYALAVIDAQMPGKDGFELAQDVKKDDRLSGTKLLMLTSAGQRGDIQRCKEVGIDGYLTKPATRTDLLEMIAALLSNETKPELVTRHMIAESRRRLSILLAEDNPVNQEVAAAMLRKRGHKVDVVSNGVEAVAAVTRAPYDLVLMDIQMPEMDGFEATRRIREGAAAHVSIIALTAHALTGERERCLANGMNGYLSKPFRAHDLFAIVESIGEESEASTTTESEIPAPAVDLEAFRRSMREAGAEEAVDAILELFAQTAPERVAALNAAMESGDAKAIANAAHAFKSPSSAIGALRLGGLLQEIELAGKVGDIPRARAAFANLDTETAAVLAALQSSNGSDGNGTAASRPTPTAQAASSASRTS
jgi:two-component system sensor histidine kinase/response regulator